jgi:hypothetical protein
MSIKPGRQIGDLLAYILLPLATVLLPFRSGDALIRSIAYRGWLLNGRSRAFASAAGNVIHLDEPENWKARWRLVELSDARDAWYCFFGRSRSLVKSVDPADLSAAHGPVLVGAHWGIGLRALIVFRHAGLQPRFVYRRVERDILRFAPFQYLYLKILVACIRRVCGERSIEVPGARRAFESALDEEGSPVILLDAPAMNPDTALNTRVLGHAVALNPDGARLLAEKSVKCSFFALGVSWEGRTILNCNPPFTPSSAAELIAAYGDFLTGLLEQDSAQWRLWHAAPQFFGETGRSAAPG